MLELVGKNVIKTILYLFNIFLGITGLLFIIAGSYVISDIGEYEHFVTGRAISIPICLILAGIFIFFVSLMGCYGASKESSKVLMFFAVLLAVIYIIEIAIGVAAIVYKSDLQMSLNKSLEETIRRSNRDDIVAWDHAQQRLMCCGVTGPSDWIDMSRNKTLRSSCCRPEFIDTISNDCREALPYFKDKYYQDGCIMKLEEKIGENQKILIGLGLGIAFVQFLGIFLACWLASVIKRENAK